MDTSVIIVAAGNSSRMNGENKQLLKIGGIPVIVRSMQAFEVCENVNDIVVVTKPNMIDTVKSLASEYGIKKFTFAVNGGETRQQSVMCGLKEISKETSLIAIHDGARPLVKPEFIKKAIADAKIFGGAVLGVPVKDTIKSVSDGLIIDTPPRSQLYAVQTPQIFKRALYFEGITFAKAHDLDFTDDCQLSEAIGVKIYITESDYENIKITTYEDVKIAEALLQKEDLI